MRPDQDRGFYAGLVGHLSRLSSQLLRRARVQHALAYFRRRHSAISSPGRVLPAPVGSSNATSGVWRDARDTNGVGPPDVTTARPGRPAPR